MPIGNDAEILGVLCVAHTAPRHFDGEVWPLQVGLLAAGCLPHLRSDQISALGGLLRVLEDEATSVGVIALLLQARGGCCCCVCARGEAHGHQCSLISPPIPPLARSTLAAHPSHPPKMSLLNP